MNPSLVTWLRNNYLYAIACFHIANLDFIEKREVKPDAVTDDFAGEAMGGDKRWNFHHCMMPQHQLSSSLIKLAVPLHAFCYNRATQLLKQIERPEVIQTSSQRNSYDDLRIIYRNNSNEIDLSTRR